MDITSLYTVIPNSKGLLALKIFFYLRTVKEPSLETLLRLAELALTLNSFSLTDSDSPTARKHGKPQNSRTKIYFSNRHS